MTRSVLCAVMLAFTLMGAGFTASPAAAQEKKGIFSFFNRSNDAGDKSPVHMSPGTQGAAAEDGSKAYGYGKAPQSTTRYEDSPIFAEAQRAQKDMANWVAADKARALAEGAALNEQSRAQNEYNKKVAKEQQAAKVAEAAKAYGAGTPPAGLSAAQQKALMAKGLGSSPAPVQQGANGMIVPPPSSRLPANASPGKARPQGLFNRIDED